MKKIIKNNSYKYDSKNRITEYIYCNNRYIESFVNYKYSYPDKKNVIEKKYFEDSKTINLNKNKTIKDDRTYKSGYLKTYADDDANFL